MNVDGNPAEANQPHHVEELWFEDGNIILQAGNRQFRVHRGILARHSPIFQDMLSFPQPPDSEIIEGCPLVRLADSPGEVAIFLRAIFEPTFFLPFPSETEFGIIQSCLRLSHKYEVEYLRRRALVHLTSRYRTTLSEWDTSHYADEPSSSHRGSSEIISWPYPRDFKAYTISVVQLAQEVDAPWILPLAFYALSSGFVGLTREFIQGTVYSGAHISLSAQTQEAFLDGHNIQILSATGQILPVFSHPPHAADCISPAACTRLRLQAIESLRKTICQYPSLPLHVWTANDWELLDVCPTCLDLLKTTHQLVRQMFWDRLPGIYGLPPWEELEKMKIAAIGTNWYS
ncbi:hypothetical protein B0H11DRAFT_2004025 [Mycena galericulata]|nr:hypothetical protein B0H11DRAFT_2004025 [Mycena galericulata]